jgi:voltage-gated potassium channel
MPEVVEKGRILFTPRKRTPMQTVMVRTLFILFLLVLIILVFYIKKDELHDSSDGVVSFADVVYFTFITVTTVGYGDIVPVTEGARIIDALLVTPLRVIIWLTFLGTAMELIIPRYMEGYRLKMLKEKLSEHVIVTGYGSTGKAVVEELINKGQAKESIVIIDNDTDRVEQAVKLGVIGLRGDATTEDVLSNAVIEKAKHIIITTGRDDTNVLISLTARDMNKKIKIVARVKDEENMKLLERASADVVMAPPVTGGKLMAIATLRLDAAKVLEDILTAKHGLDIGQRNVRESELGKMPKALPNIVVLAVKRGDKIWDPPELDRVKLREGDMLIYIKSVEEE